MTLQVDKRAVARAFGRAAGHYDAHAALQRLSGDALRHRLVQQAMAGAW